MVLKISLLFALCPFLFAHFYTYSTLLHLFIYIIIYINKSYSISGVGWYLSKTITI